MRNLLCAGSEILKVVFELAQKSIKPILQRRCMLSPRDSKPDSRTVRNMSAEGVFEISVGLSRGFKANNAHAVLLFVHAQLASDETTKIE